MKKIYENALFFVGILLLSIFACKNENTLDKPNKPNNPEETAKLKTLTIGDYVATEDDIEKASKA